MKNLNSTIEFCVKLGVSQLHSEISYFYQPLDIFHLSYNINVLWFCSRVHRFT